MDTLLTPLMDSLRACLCAALEDTTAGPAGCFCALMPGQQVPADWCQCTGTAKCGGMAWVRLDGMFPSGDRFPAQDASTKGSCAKVLAAVLEVGVYRCVPTPSARGAAPGAVEQTNATVEAVDDAMAMHSAIACCDAIQSRPHVLGRYVPRDSGDCGGGVWTVTVQLLRR